MASKEKVIAENRRQAESLISYLNHEEAMVHLAENICLLLNTHEGKADPFDLALLKEAVEKIGMASIVDKIHSDLAYALRLTYSVNLDVLEIDFMYTLIEGSLERIIAIGQFEGGILDKIDSLDWIAEDILIRSDLQASENRMSRAYAGYVKISDLLELLRKL